MLSLLGVASAPPAIGDDDTPTTDTRVVDEITVTAAEKRETDLQTTPHAVTALGADDLERSGIEGNEDLQFQVPSLHFGVINADTQITLRAIGTENITPGGDPGVALHVDGVYLGRPNAALIDFLDLEQVEVLRGPQGTLYGRNSIGGSINLITRGPGSELRAALALALGDYEQLAVVGSAGGPLTDWISGQLSFTTDERDGFHDNLFDGSSLDDSDYTAVRGRLDFAFSDSSELAATGFVHDEGGTGSVAKNLDDGIDDPRASARDFPQSQDNSFAGLTATYGYTRPGWVLTSLTSVQDMDTEYTFDSDGTAQPIQHLTTILEGEQLSQELRVASASGGRGQWQVGAYYLDEDLVGDFDLEDAFLGIYTIDSTVDTESFAIFGRYAHDVGDSLRVYGGLRYNDDDKSAVDAQFLPAFGIDFAIPQSVSYDEMTGDLGVDVQLSPSSFLYAKYSRGYKSGGFNLPGDGQPYLPEFVNAWEVGIKNLLSERRVRLNASAFHYDYEDMQVFQIRNFQTLIENAAEATIDGVEVEVQARLIPGNLLDASVGWLDAEYDNFSSVDFLNPGAGIQDLSGNRLNRAPEWSFHVGAQHALELAGDAGYLTPRVEYSWRDEVFFRQFNLPRESQGSFSRVDLRVMWDSAGGRYRAEVYGKNLGDDDVIGNMLINATNLSATYYAPLTWGGSFGVRW
ncbi:MAG: TonB-dependent receptor [Thermoanaerobaculia bacterium]|nr:TonB-dependent receptor [Thermoanaerobaculia bacterium]